MVTQIPPLHLGQRERQFELEKKLWEQERQWEQFKMQAECEKREYECKMQAECEIQRAQAQSRIAEVEAEGRIRCMEERLKYLSPGHRDITPSRQASYSGMTPMNNRVTPSITSAWRTPSRQASYSGVTPMDNRVTPSITSAGRQKNEIDEDSLTRPPPQLPEAVKGWPPFITKAIGDKDITNLSSRMNAVTLDDGKTGRYAWNSGKSPLSQSVAAEQSLVKQEPVAEDVAGIGETEARCVHGVDHQGERDDRSTTSQEKLMANILSKCSNVYRSSPPGLVKGETRDASPEPVEEKTAESFIDELHMKYAAVPEEVRIMSKHPEKYGNPDELYPGQFIQRLDAYTGRPVRGADASNRANSPRLDKDSSKGRAVPNKICRRQVLPFSRPGMFRPPSQIRWQGLSIILLTQVLPFSRPGMVRPPSQIRWQELSTITLRISHRLNLANR